MKTTPGQGGGSGRVTRSATALALKQEEIQPGDVIMADPVQKEHHATVAAKLRKELAIEKRENLELKQKIADLEKNHEKQELEAKLKSVDDEKERLEAKLKSISDEKERLEAKLKLVSDEKERLEAKIKESENILTKILNERELKIQELTSLNAVSSAKVCNLIKTKLTLK